MKTEILTKDGVEQAAQFIRAGELVSFPTETVYGLGADAKNEAAVKKVYLAKGRPSDNPLIVHVAGVEQVREFADLSPEFLTLTTAFWPGPLTLILPIFPGSLSKSVTGGLTTCAFRMPDNQVTLSLIQASGTVLVGPSANTSGKPSPTTAQHVYHDLAGKIAAILDDGPTAIGLESTVLDLSEPAHLTILRPGAITQSELAEVMGRPIYLDRHLVKESETPKAPGMKYKHYSPNADVVMMPVGSGPADFAEALQAYADKNVGLLADDKILTAFPATPGFSLGAEKNPVSASRYLFAGLRELDETCDVILAETFADEKVGAAYMNRLKKASAGHWYGEK